MQCTILKIKKEQYVQIYLTKEDLKAIIKREKCMKKPSMHL